MSGKEDCTDEDEEVVEKVESAEDAVDVVSASHDALVAADHSGLAKGCDHEDEVQLEVEKEAEDSSPEYPKDKTTCWLEGELLCGLVILDREEAQEETHMEDNLPVREHIVFL